MNKTINFIFRLCLFSLLTVSASTVYAQRGELFDNDWRFHFGNAADPARDFGCGTEYFNYLTKAASIHNTGPYSEKFDDSSWEQVSLPHDFVVGLPFAPEASHSHGYKTVGYKYPETSVGWYRKTFRIDNDDFGKHFALLFDGMFRNSRVWVNGFYCGGDESGYLSQYYDITEYLNYGGDNIVCVRVDATLEEGWFYEGAGIYRHVWLQKKDPVHMTNDGLFVAATARNIAADGNADVNIEVDVVNCLTETARCSVSFSIADAQGNIVAENDGKNSELTLLPRQTEQTSCAMKVSNPQLWSPDSPYLYTLTAKISREGKTVGIETVRFGIRDVVFDPDKGFFINGKPMKIQGFNMHQDHAGVGSAIPDNLLEYRVRTLKSIGCNTIRASHNPSTSALLDVCDSLGMFVVEENRLSGTSDFQISSLKRTIMRARNHPSVILWSVGNEEWGIEWNEKGERIAAAMRDYCHRFDPTREMSFATSGGPTVEVPVDVAGYNYIVQNPIEEHRANYPDRRCYGSEETTGCGTRGVYFDDPEGRWVMAHNRKPDQIDSVYNRIERGWRFYAERPWAAGCCFWTGFDYRGESNPLSYPATGSLFGVFDYCGFPKDEAYYLKSWWTDEDVLHILPHWNLKGHEGETVKVWVYSNCDEVELYVNGKSLGRKVMPRNGHLEWDAQYAPGRVKAVGYRNGRRIVKTVETTGEAEKVVINADRAVMKAEKGQVAVFDISLCDKKGRFVPDASQDLIVTVDGEAQILGFGNGDSAYRTVEQPDKADPKHATVASFNGRAQIIVTSTGVPGTATVTVALAQSQKPVSSVATLVLQ